MRAYQEVGPNLNITPPNEILRQALNLQKEFPNVEPALFANFIAEAKTLSLKDPRTSTDAVVSLNIAFNAWEKRFNKTQG